MQENRKPDRRRRGKRWWPAWLLPVLLCIPVQGASAPAAIPFRPGEEFHFAVKFGFIRAGSATMAVKGPETVNGEPALRLVSTARTSRVFTTFFPVHDRVISLWSPRMKLPLLFERHIREGKYHKDEVVRFDHERGVAIHADGTEMSIPPGTQDVLSAFYLVRTLDLRPGMVLDVPNYSDGKNYPLKVRVLRRETIQVPAGRFSCVVVEPLLKSAGLFKQEGRLTIWISDDARRIPVLMKSKVAVGSIVAELESMRGGGRVLEKAAAVSGRSRGTR